ncbi:MAG: hypothetical protein ACRDSR_27430 [Pseudonocardiaceae bacterium]
MIVGVQWAVVAFTSLMLARRNRRRWFILAASLGVLTLVISVGWLALIWVRDGAMVADPRASVLGFLLAAVLVAVTLVGWVRRQRAAAAAPVTAEQARQAAATLAEVVAEPATPSPPPAPHSRQN